MDWAASRPDSPDLIQVRKMSVQPQNWMLAERKHSLFGLVLFFLGGGIRSV